MNPRDMITQSVADSIRSEALFQSVVRKGTGVEPAYVLKGNIERLEEVDEGRDVRVVCTISAQLLDTQTKSIIWTHTASETIAVQNRNVAGVVSSLSTAARMAVDDLVKSLAETLPSAKVRRAGLTSSAHRCCRRGHTPRLRGPHVAISCEMAACRHQLWHVFTELFVIICAASRQMRFGRQVAHQELRIPS